MNNLENAAKILKCEPTTDAIALALAQQFPAIRNGSKNQHDLVEELKLGRCELDRSLSEIVRVVNLIIVQVYDRNKRPLTPIVLTGRLPETPAQTAQRGLERTMGETAIAEIQYLGQFYSKDAPYDYPGISSVALKHEFMAILQ